MDAIQEIKKLLQGFPQLRFEADDNRILVLPDSIDGFSVEMTRDDGCYTVFFEGWHESFTVPEEAVNCFCYGLSSDCRLKEYRRWGFPYRWVLEYKDAEEWIEDSATTLLVFPYFGRKRVKILQNNLIPCAENVS